VILPDVTVEPDFYEWHKNLLAQRADISGLPFNTAVEPAEIRKRTAETSFPMNCSLQRICTRPHL